MGWPGTSGSGSISGMCTISTAKQVSAGGTRRRAVISARYPGRSSPAAGSRTTNSSTSLTATQSKNCVSAEPCSDRICQRRWFTDFRSAS